MSVSVSSVMNKSSSDGCGVLGASFGNGGAARRLHCIPTVGCSRGFSVSVAACIACTIIS